MNWLYDFKILDNGITVDHYGQEVRGVDTSFFDTVGLPDGSVSLVRKMKEQIINMSVAK